MANASAISKLTKAQLADMVARLEASASLQSERIAQLEQAASDAPATDAPAAPADFMVTGYLRSVTPVTRKNGSVVNDSLTADGFFRVSVDTTAGVNYGSSDAPKWENITAKTAWFTTDGTVAATLIHLKEVNAWTAVRVWFRLSSNKDNVIDVAQKDYATGADRTDEDGQVLTRRALKHAADARIAQVDVVAEQVASDQGSEDGYGF